MANFAEFIPFDDKTPEFSLKGSCYYGRIVEQYDGDTLKCVINLFDSGRFVKFTFRMAGIDTPEIKTATQHTAAIRARNRLMQLIIGEGSRISIDTEYTKRDIIEIYKSGVYVVWIKCLGADKYGRQLAEIYLTADSRVSLGEILIREGHAKSYDGKSKMGLWEHVDLGETGEL